ncbi:major facilitator superfamily domain-containing protein [Piptocephalis cylindrospora]|uniref:Major facilitator superfamily domain-containing protein n=1 Tax=Piptocephalis cylindrospora TaxID=1907219 RepID=A0A4P9Y114_9FUNG|nr:major facilitator superfamily domain-containing protein [Piptocephalis cylindrospora]|eukprot:RKP11751.1 major facilitator superfamily domain-containing protein [Piptocephalis cylindrospora]
MSTTQRTFSFLAALLAATSAGTVYTFSTFSTQLAHRLAYTEFQLGVVATCGSYGQFLSGPFLGLAAERIGPRISCIIASVLLLCGYSGLAFLYSDTTPFHHFLLASLSFCLVGIGSSLTSLSFLSTLSVNFSQARGLIIGFPLGILGLSGFLYARTNALLFIHADDPTFSFLRFLAITTFTSVLTASFGLRYLPSNAPKAEDASGSGDERSTEVDLEIEQEEGTIASPKSSLSSSISGDPERIQDAPLAHQEVAREPVTESTRLLKSSTSTLLHPSDPPKTATSVVRGWELIGNTDARLLFLFMAIIGGSGLMYINSVGRILAILHPHLTPDSPALRSIQSHHVAMLSFFSFFGRVGFGFGSDLTLRWISLRRTSWLVLASVIMFSGNFIAATGLGGIQGLNICTATVGMSFGAMFAVSATLVGEWFGPTAFSSNWGMLGCGPAIAAQLANTAFGMGYDHERARGCHGVECYGDVFIGTTFACIVAIFASLTLLHRRRAITRSGSFLCI